jgi:hypothetical protein
VVKKKRGMTVVRCYQQSIDCLCLGLYRYRRNRIQHESKRPPGQVPKNKEPYCHSSLFHSSLSMIGVELYLFVARVMVGLRILVAEVAM